MSEKCGVVINECVAKRSLIENLLQLFRNGEIKRQRWFWRWQRRKEKSNGEEENGEGAINAESRSARTLSPLSNSWSPEKERTKFHASAFSL